MDTRDAGTVVFHQADGTMGGVRSVEVDVPTELAEVPDSRPHLAVRTALRWRNERI